MTICSAENSWSWERFESSRNFFRGRHSNLLNNRHSPARSSTESSNSDPKRCLFAFSFESKHKTESLELTKLWWKRRLLVFYIHGVVDPHLLARVAWRSTSEQAVMEIISQPTSFVLLLSLSSSKNRNTKSYFDAVRFQFWSITYFNFVIIDLTRRNNIKLIHYESILCYKLLTTHQRGMSFFFPASKPTVWQICDLASSIDYLMRSMIMCHKMEVFILSWWDFLSVASPTYYWMSFPKLFWFFPFDSNWCKLVTASV